MTAARPLTLKRLLASILLFAEDVSVELILSCWLCEAMVFSLDASFGSMFG